MVPKVSIMMVQDFVCLKKVVQVGGHVHHVYACGHWREVSWHVPPRLYEAASHKNHVEGATCTITICMSKDTYMENE
jgi:hypothetical protein